MKDDDNELIPVLMDADTGLPCCVIWQAAAGPGRFDNRLPLHIIAGEWEVNPKAPVMVTAPLAAWREFAKEHLVGVKRGAAHEGKKKRRAALGAMVLRAEGA